jgi:hypothetical protein
MLTMLAGQPQKKEDAIRPIQFNGIGADACGVPLR